MARPVFYSLKTVGDVDFWAQAGGTARRTLIMPLANPLEFIAFGVLAPLDQVLFVARGEMLAHLGNFLSRMAQAGASAELYTRVPLPDSIVEPYLKDDPYEQKEADRPPPSPDLTGHAAIRTGGASLTMSIASNESGLWTMTGSARRVLVVAVPGSTSASLAIGMVMVDQSDYLWRVNFVAHVANGSALTDFLSKMPEGTTVENPPTALPAGWDDYMANPFSPGQGLAAMTMAQLGQATSGAKRLSLR